MPKSDQSEKTSRKRDGIAHTTHEVPSAKQTRVNRPSDIMSLSVGYQTGQFTTFISWKSPIKEWNRSPNTGKWFSMLTEDTCSDIRITAYNDECDKFHGTVSEGHTLTFTNFNVKFANGRYNFSTHNLEIVLTKSTEVVIGEALKPPARSLKFTDLKTLQRVPKDRVVNICAVIAGVGSAQPLTSKKNGQQLLKREIILMDDTATVTTLTLCNQDVSKLTGGENQILSIAGTKTSMFKTVA